MSGSSCPAPPSPKRHHLPGLEAGEHHAGQVPGAGLVVTTAFTRGGLVDQVYTVTMRPLAPTFGQTFLQGCFGFAFPPRAFFSLLKNSCTRQCGGSIMLVYFLCRIRLDPIPLCWMQSCVYNYILTVRYMAKIV